MRVFLIALLAVSASKGALAQQFGPGENLAPYIPTPQILVERMLEVARVRPADMVYDLGSGDGRIVIAAAQKFGARAVGVELDPALCRRAEERIKALGLGDRITVMHTSALHVDLTPATVVTLYLLTGSNEKLRPNMEKDLRAGARVVSNDYPIQGWKPVEMVIVQTGSMRHRIYLYTIGQTH